VSTGSKDSQNFADRVRTACSEFEALERLIQLEIKYQSKTRRTKPDRLRAIMSLANSFIFQVNRAHRICKHGIHVLGGHRAERKAFLRYVKNIGLVYVRNQNEHGFDPPNAGKGHRGGTAPIFHELNGIGVSIGEASLVMSPKILMVRSIFTRFTES
jgi:hypothetical protein